MGTIQRSQLFGNHRAPIRSGVIVWVPMRPRRFRGDSFELCVILEAI